MNDSAIGWTGSIETCTPGTTSPLFRQGVLNRVNYFRAMAGVPDDILFDQTYNAKAQAAALMESANHGLTHNPPSDWECFTDDGRDGAGHSNLFSGVFGAAAVTGYVHDGGGYPCAPCTNSVGHRRWILYPQTQQMGTGDILPTSVGDRFNALWVIDSHYGDSRPQTREEFVAWPPPGYVPDEVIFPLWSFSYPGADFTNTEVTMTKNGSPTSLVLHAPVNGYGDNTLVWEPAGTAQADYEYQVTVSHVLISGIQRTFSYRVIDFEADNIEPTITLPTPPDGAVYARGEWVHADYSCMDDRGGSGLASCVGTVPDGSPIPTSALGRQEFTVIATDNAGNTAHVTHTYTVRDMTDPSVDLRSPPANSSYPRSQAVIADYFCTDDRGGSGLASCVGTVPDGSPIPTSALGRQEFTVIATDNAGNTAQVTHTYTVEEHPQQPDLRLKFGRTFVGDDVYNTTGDSQTTWGAGGAGAVFTQVVSMQNDGPFSDRLTIKGSAPTSGLAVRYVTGGADITSSVVAGTYLTRSLAPGATQNIKVVATLTRNAPNGILMTRRLTATSATDGLRRDRVKLVYSRY